MALLFYFRLVLFTAGAILHLFLLVLLVGYRLRSAFERLLFLAGLSLFLFHAGSLLRVNAQIHYLTPPRATVQFAAALIAAGLGLLPAFLVHLHVAHYRAAYGTRGPRRMSVLAVGGYLPLAYFVPFGLPHYLKRAPLQFLYPVTRLNVLYGLWLTSALLCGMFFLARFAAEPAQGYHRARFRGLLAVYGLAAALLVSTYVMVGRDPFMGDVLATGAVLCSLLPGAFLGYFGLRYRFLEPGVQRNLAYGVSVGFLALLYLAVARRASTWLEPVLPPEATISILLFALVVFIEPLQRRVAGAFHRTFRREMDRLQRLTAELREEAHRGDVSHFVAFAEKRIANEFGLSQVRLVLDGQPPQGTVDAERVHRFPLRKEQKETGALAVYSHAAVLPGETLAVLELLAEQLPAMIDLCRLLEEKLQLERELAERERLALVGQMAASISHNLKNPLGSMKTILQVQLENPELSASLRQDCAVLVAEIDRLSAKLGQLLRYAKPSVRAGGAPQRVAALALAEQVVTLLGHDAERRHVRLELENQCGETFARGPEEALSDVLSNLVVNAIEVLPAGGTVQVRLERRGANLILEVTDDGPGIPAEFRGKIFQPFFTTKPSGTGLGLAIVERRVAEMGGEIHWESPAQNGRGTRFKVKLPVAD